MADPDDRTRHEGVSPDGRPRRQPPIIDVEAVEVSLDGSRATTAGSDPPAGPSGTRQSLRRILTFMPPAKFAIIGSACAVAAIIGGALWIYLTADGSDGPQRNAASPAAAVSNEVVERIAKPEADPRVAALESRIAALDATLAPLGDRIAALERAVRDAAAAAGAAGERADKAGGLLAVPPPPRAAEGREGGEEQNRAQPNDRAALEALAHRVTALEARQAALQQKQEGVDRLATAPDETIRVATVATALRSAVERNSPFTAEFGAARSLGLDERALAALAPFAATGLPTRTELFHSLSTLVPELRHLSVPSAQDLGYLERLQASAVKMLNIRPVREEPGDDPATVMSRIEFKMPQQDIEAMVAELDKLPAPARELAQGWRTKALARQEALESARLIAAAALAKLGEPALRGPSPP
jgi:hypothetical protein